MTDSGESVYYLIVAALAFLAGTLLGDQVMQGFSIGVGLMTCITWMRRKFKSPAPSQE